jgi:transcription initiation factor TFIIB
MAPPQPTLQQQARPLSDEERFKRKVHHSIKFTIQCPDCKTDEYLVEDEGRNICSNCGVVCEDQVIDLGAEWHNYDEDGEDKSRVGSAGDPLLGNDLSTEIANSKNNNGVLRAHIRNTKTNPDKNLKEGFQKIEELSEKMDLPSKHRNTAKELFKSMNDHKPIKASKDILGFVTASLYGSCKIGGIPRQIKEFTALTGLEKKVIGKYYKRIEAVSKANLAKSHGQDGLNVGYQSATPAQMIPRFARNLKLAFKAQSAAEQVAQAAVDHGITSGKAPTTVAAAALFMVTQISRDAGDRRAIKEVVEVTGVSEPTIRKCLKDLTDNQSLVIPKDFPIIQQ